MREVQGAGKAPIGRRRWLGQMLLLGSALVSLPACSLLDREIGGDGQNTPEEPSEPPTTRPGSDSRTDGAEGGGDFGATCTTTGAHAVSSSAQRSLEGAPEVDGKKLTVALGSISSQGPSMRLYLSTVGGTEEPVQFDGAVGDSLNYEGWELTITAICSDEVRFDVDVA